MSSNDQGFTVIEIMISLVVALLIFMGLTQTSLVAIDSGMRTVLREEAVHIAEGQMSQVRNAAYPPAAPSGSVTRNFRNITGFTYTVTGSSTILGTVDCNRQVSVRVGWTWKGNPQSYTTSSVVRSPTC